MTLRQQPLYHDRRVAGFWATVRIGATVDIDDAAWKKATADNALVGTCRECGGYLAPGMPYQIGRVYWYPGKCIVETCGYEIAGHGPRPSKTAQSHNGSR